MQNILKTFNKIIIKYYEYSLIVHLKQRTYNIKYQLELSIKV